MKTNQLGIDLIKKFEGCYLTAYLCPARVLTIGIGHTGPDVKPGMVISLYQAEELLKKDLERFEKAVTATVSFPLNENQFSALVAFAFNVGPDAFRKSTLVRLLNGGDYQAVPLQLMRWNKAAGKVLAGLTKRRQAEGELFMLEC